MLIAGPLLIKNELAKAEYDEYDWLIQLCDSLAGAEGVPDIEERMGDVKKRWGKILIQCVNRILLYLAIYNICFDIISLIC